MKHKQQLQITTNIYKQN